MNQESMKCELNKKLISHIALSSFSSTQKKQQMVSLVWARLPTQSCYNEPEHTLKEWKKGKTFFLNSFINRKR